MVIRPNRPRRREQTTFSAQPVPRSRRDTRRFGYQPLDLSNPAAGGVIEYGTDADEAEVNRYMNAIGRMEADVIEWARKSTNMIEHSSHTQEMSHINNQVYSLLGGYIGGELAASKHADNPFKAARSLAKAGGVYMLSMMAFPEMHEGGKRWGLDLKNSIADRVNEMGFIPQNLRDRVNLWRDRGLARANGGRLPFTPESAALTQIALTNNASMQLGQTTNPDEHARIIEAWQAASNNLRTMYTMDGLEDHEVSSALTDISVRLAVNGRPPRYAGLVNGDIFYSKDASGQPTLMISENADLGLALYPALPPEPRDSQQIVTSALHAAFMSAHELTEDERKQIAGVGRDVNALEGADVDKEHGNEGDEAARATTVEAVLDEMDEADGAEEAKQARKDVSETQVRLQKLYDTIGQPKNADAALVIAQLIMEGEHEYMQDRQMSTMYEEFVENGRIDMPTKNWVQELGNINSVVYDLNEDQRLQLTKQLTEQNGVSAEAYYGMLKDYFKARYRDEAQAEVADVPHTVHELNERLPLDGHVYNLMHGALMVTSQFPQIRDENSAERRVLDTYMKAQHPKGDQYLALMLDLTKDMKESALVKTAGFMRDPVPAAALDRTAREMFNLTAQISGKDVSRVIPVAPPVPPREHERLATTGWGYGFNEMREALKAAEPISREQMTKAIESNAGRAALVQNVDGNYAMIIPADQYDEYKGLPTFIECRCEDGTMARYKLDEDSYGKAVQLDKYDSGWKIVADRDTGGLYECKPGWQIEGEDYMRLRRLGDHTREYQTPKSRFEAEYEPFGKQDVGHNNPTPVHLSERDRNPWQFSLEGESEDAVVVEADMEMEM